MLSKLTLEEQFKLCFIYLPKPHEKHINLIVSAFDFKKQEFERLLFKTELEPYIEILWLYGLKEVIIKHFNEFQKLSSNTNGVVDSDTFSKSFSDFLDHVINYKPELVSVDEDGWKHIDLTSQEKKNEELELTESLYFLLSEQSKGISLNFKSQITTSKFNSSSDFMVSAIINALIAEYAKKNYNEVNLNYEEAEWELLSLIDLDWIRKYIVRFEGVTQAEIDEDIYFFDSYEAYINIRDIEEYIDSDMINEYADDHYKKADVTLEFITDRYKELKAKHKPKVGAKAKNDNIASLSERISYLIRLKRFLEQSEHDDISKFPISNKDCRLIHEYLVFWRLLESKSTSNNTTTPDNYIKALIKNYRQHRKLVRENNMVHYLINSYKKNGVFPIK